MNKEKYLIIKLCLILYSCILFSLAIFVPVFVPNISEEGKFGLYFLQDASFAWVSGAFLYYFGEAFVRVLKKVPSLLNKDNEKN